jgi:hypothetical protein
LLAGKSPNTRSCKVYIYGSGQAYACHISLLPLPSSVSFNLSLSLSLSLSFRSTFLPAFHSYFALLHTNVTAQHSVPPFFPCAVPLLTSQHKTHTLLHASLTHSSTSLHIPTLSSFPALFPLKATTHNTHRSLQSSLTAAHPYTYASERHTPCIIPARQPLGWTRAVPGAP